MMIIMIMSSSNDHSNESSNDSSTPPTPGLHNKIPAHNIFARVWVAQKSLFFS